MEDKRTALAIFLCLSVVILYSNLVLAPKLRPQAPAAVSVPAAQNSAVQPNVAQPVGTGQSVPSSAPATTIAHGSAAPSASELDAAGAVTVRSEMYEIEFVNLGARVRHLRLLRYKEHKGAEGALDLIVAKEGSTLPLGVLVGMNALNDDHVRYSVTRLEGPQPLDAKTWELSPEAQLVLAFRGELAGGIKIEKKVTLQGASNLFKVDVNIDRPAADGSNVWLEWTHFIPGEVAHRRYDSDNFLLLNDAQRIVHVKSDGFAQGVVDQGSNSWAGFNSQYFMSVLIPSVKGTSNTRVGRDGDIYFVRTLSTPTGGSFEVYAGPKDSRVLAKLPHLLERSIDLGLFSFLAFPLLSLISVFHDWLGNYGLAIILLTLVIKALFLPLTQKSFKSMRAMQEIQPEMKALRERIKDPTQLNQEVMALYRRKGVNPLGGCLPMLIQLPVFLGLYNALLNSIELRHSPFALWITDLSTPEALHIAGIPVPVMVLLMGLSMYVQQATTPPVGDPQQQKIMKFMPIVFTAMFIIFPMPSGLVLYWFVSNIISIIQQVYLKRAEAAAPMYATAVASLVIFGIGFVLSLLPRWS